MVTIPSENTSELEIVVASLASAVERRRRVEAMMDGAPWRWRIFDACTTPPENLSYDDAQALVEKGRSLSPTELATFATHYSILREFAERGATDYMLVLEDDVLIDRGFWFERLPALMRSTGIEMLRLYARYLHDCRSVAPIGPRHMIVRFERPVFGGQAYVVSREGARRLTAGIRKVVRPCDDEFDRFWENGVPLYALFPFPAMELEVPSTIYGRESRPARLTLRQSVVRDMRRRVARWRRKLASYRLRLADHAISMRLRGMPFP